MSSTSFPVVQALQFGWYFYSIQQIFQIGHLLPFVPNCRGLRRPIEYLLEIALLEPTRQMTFNFGLQESNLACILERWFPIHAKNKVPPFGSFQIYRFYSSLAVCKGPFKMTKIVRFRINFPEMESPYLTSKKTFVLLGDSPL